jgi:hypothetical protein
MKIPVQKLCIIALLLCAFLSGQRRRPGAVFLLIWPGARPTALAGSFAAIADDPTACYYNQAGLAFIDRTMITLQHANWLPALQPDMYYEFAGIVKSYSFGTLGLNIIYLTTGKTMVVNEEGIALGEYTTFDISIGFNYGFQLNSKVGLGMGWKIIYSYLVPDWVIRKMPELGIEKGGTGITYAFDAGVLYKPFEFLNLACVLQNIGPNIGYTQSGSDDPLPYTLRLAGKFNPIQNKIITITLTADVTKILVGMFAEEDNSFFDNLQYELETAWKSIGLEINYYGFVNLRTGYFIDQEGARKGITYGGGVQVGDFSLDVGIDQAIYEFTTTNRKFSLCYSF